MTVRNIEEYDQNLVGIGAIVSYRKGLRKSAQIDNDKRFRNHDDKIESVHDDKLDKRVSKAIRKGRKANIKTEKIETLENFSLEEEKPSQKKYPCQSKIGMPSKKIIRSVNKELKSIYGEKLK